MPLPLPNLDTRRFDDLVAEMRALIPQYAPEWTNHNPSDPGITFVELMAWVTETTLYRVNRIPDQVYWNFLRWLRPPEDRDAPRWEDLQALPLKAARVEALRWFNAQYRAVTTDDFEAVVTRSFPVIARAKAQSDPIRGMMTVVIIPQPGTPNEAKAEAGSAIKQFLDQRRLVGTRVRVRGAIYTPVHIKVRGVLAQDTDKTRVETAVRVQIASYLDPLTGGPEKMGWPFDRPVSIYDLLPQIASVAGVARVHDVVLDRQRGQPERPIRELPQPTVEVTLE